MSVPTGSLIAGFSGGWGIMSPVVPDEEGYSLRVGTGGELEWVPPITTRRIPLVPSDIAVADATDAHGTLPTTSRVHWDLPNSGSDEHLVFVPVIIPTDYVDDGNATLQFLWSNSVGSNDWRRQYSVSGLGAGDTAETFFDNGTGNITVTAADTLFLNSVAADNTATWEDSVLLVRISRLSGNAGDTNTGTTSIWGAWLEYTSKLFAA